MAGPSIPCPGERHDGIEEIGDESQHVVDRAFPDEIEEIAVEALSGESCKRTFYTSLLSIFLHRQRFNNLSISWSTWWPQMAHLRLLQHDGVQQSFQFYLYRGGNLNLWCWYISKIMLFRTKARVLEAYSAAIYVPSELCIRTLVLVLVLPINHHNTVFRYHLL